MLTIGQLAKQVGMPTSTLRYYEQEGLLTPNGRSEAGYRLYKPEQAQRLRFIQRAQRLGFSLADIGTLLRGWETGDLNNDDLVDTARRRYHTLEKQVTALLVVQHELGLFLQDLRAEGNGRHFTADAAFTRLLDHVCSNPVAQPPAQTMLTWLAENTGCVLTSDAGQAILERLRGQHVHVWQEGETYHILVISQAASVLAALHELAQLETSCTVHDHPAPELNHEDEGIRFTAYGENAFIFARLFLALEQEQAPTQMVNGT